MTQPDDKRIDPLADLRAGLAESEDSDGDGVTDAEERRQGTDPNDEFDTPIDLNQLPDSKPEPGPAPQPTPTGPSEANREFWKEHYEATENPDGSITIEPKHTYESPGKAVDPDGLDFKKDSDGDGLTDVEELTQWRTDPNSADTDRDGRPDKDEVDQGFDPVRPTPPNATRDDRDGDSVPDLQELMYPGVTTQDVDAGALVGGSDAERWASVQKGVYDQRKTGDPIGDAALRQQLGVPATDKEDDDLTRAIGDSLVDPDPLVRLRGEQALAGFDPDKVDPKAQAEADEAFAEQMDATIAKGLASNDPADALGAARTLALFGQEDSAAMADLSARATELGLAERERIISDPNSNIYDLMAAMRSDQLGMLPPLDDASRGQLGAAMDRVIAERAAGMGADPEQGLGGPGGPAVPGAPTMPGVPTVPGAAVPGAAMPGLPGSSPGAAPPQGRQQPVTPAGQSTQQPNDPASSGGGRTGAPDPSDRNIGADSPGSDTPAATGAPGAGAVGGSPGAGTPGAGSSGGGSTPGWSQAADDLGRSGSTPSPEPVTSQGSRGNEPTGTPGSIGPLGTKPTDIPAGTSASTPAAQQGGAEGGPRGGADDVAPSRDDDPIFPVTRPDGSVDHLEQPHADGSKTIFTPNGDRAFEVGPKSEGHDASGDASGAGQGTDDNDTNDTDSDTDSDDTDSGDDSDIGDDADEETARVDDDVAGNSGAGVTDASGLRLVGVAGASAVDLRFTNTGDPNGPTAGIGPIIGGPVSEPATPGDETPQDEATTMQPGTLDETRLPGYGITTVRPDTPANTPELDPSQLGPGGETGGPRDGGGGGVAIDPSGQNHGGGIDPMQGAGLGAGPGGLEVNLDPAGPAFEGQDLLAVGNVGHDFEVQDFEAQDFEVQDFAASVDGSDLDLADDGPMFGSDDMLP